MSDQKKTTFEECLEIINEEILKRKNKWNLKEVSSLDYEDVSQILRLHVFNKWHLWDQKRPFKNWLNTVISHQMINLIRNNYGNVAPPCQGPPACVFNMGGSVCSYTPSGIKCSECRLYSDWEKTKQVGYNLKLASSTDDPDFVEKIEYMHEGPNLEQMLESLIDSMKKELTPKKYKLFQAIYITKESDDEVFSIMGVKNNAGSYKKLNNLKKEFIEKAKKILKE